MYVCMYNYMYVCMYIRLSTPPPERPRLQLQPRTKPLEDKSGGRERGEGGRASSSIFGQAKPVDTAAREREIEERLLRVSKFSYENINGTYEMSYLMHKMQSGSWPYPYTRQEFFECCVSSCSCPLKLVAMIQAMCAE